MRMSPRNAVLQLSLLTQSVMAACRDLTHYNGEPDPLKGDALNQRVRDAAKEASEALFNTVVQQPVNSLGVRRQAQGF